MRLVIDMQAAQTESRFRGIGRYALSLAQGIVRNRAGHDVKLALNGMFPETIEPIRSAFDGFMKQQDIRVWHAPGPVRENQGGNAGRRHVAERMREAFLADLEPDAVLLTSLFEGLGDDAVTSVGVFDQSIPTAAILYDLFPLTSPDVHFRTNRTYQDWYRGKLESLARTKLLLAISDATRSEALAELTFPAEDIVSISAACDPCFRELKLGDAEKANVRRRFGIKSEFAMYAGGADERKNLRRLIEAFARLSTPTRDEFQLAIVGKMPAQNVAEIRGVASELGLSDQIVFTGYVDDEDLVQLYNSCVVLVMPSLQEGFGLPALEAMSCGAAVIASNATSLPEVVGNPEAMFDPTSVDAIGRKLQAALLDEGFRLDLAKFGVLQAKKFSWDESAVNALNALVRIGDRQKRENQRLPAMRRTSVFRPQRKRILVLKLDHLGDFALALPALTKLRARYPSATIDAVVGSWNVDFARATKLFNRVHTFDFFQRRSDQAPTATADEIAALVRKVGKLDIALDFRRQSETRFILVKFDADTKVGYETFDAAIDAKLNIKVESHRDEPFVATPMNRLHASRQILTLVDALPSDPNDFISFPELVEEPLREGLEIALFPAAGNAVKEWGASNYAALADALAGDARVSRINVYFSGVAEAQGYPLPKTPKLRSHIGLTFASLTRSLAENSICVANNSFGAHLASYLNCLVIAVFGGHETVEEWAPPFGESYVIDAGARCSPCHIPATSNCPYQMRCLADIPVTAVLERVKDAIEGVVSGRGMLSGFESSTEQDSPLVVDRLISSIAEIEGLVLDQASRAAVATCVAANHRSRASVRQLLVDVSELVVRDAKSGIQRVVGALLGHFLRYPPGGFTVQPVYASLEGRGYRYARRFASRFLTSGDIDAEDAPVEVWAGDVFLGVDLCPGVVVSKGGLLEEWRRRGIEVYFVVYDLLPLQFPHAFWPGTSDRHQRWLETITRFDGAIGISKSVAKELRNWLDVFGAPRGRPFQIGWFHIGADLDECGPTRGLPITAKRVLRALDSRESFLMVGTLEPRKAQAQVLAAFERLWRAGEDVNLVLAGKQGWLVEGLVQTLQSHPEAGRRLFWLNGISDEYLEQLYRRCSALIAASEGEGFGLPLIEGARFGLPCIVRDIPVFREVAGDYAFYFSSTVTPDVIARAVQDWRTLFHVKKHPSPVGMPRKTWKESAEQLLACIFDRSQMTTWLPDGVFRYWGADARLSTSVGDRFGPRMETTGRAGHLIFGPYVSLDAGEYRIVIFCEIDRLAGGENLDLVINGGATVLLQKSMGDLKEGKDELEVSLTLENAVSDLEVRIWVDEGSRLAVTGLEIAPFGKCEKP